MRVRGAVVAAATAAVVVTGCTGDVESGPETPGPPAPATSPPPTSAPPGPPSDDPGAAPRPAWFSADRAMRHVRVLAGDIGPRLATSPAFGEAAAYVAGELRHQGYAVRRQAFDVPAGDSWGVPVAAGRSFNVVAEPPGFEPSDPHLLVGAHLDTVAVAPGAEDNASGISVLLELARLVRLAGPQSTRLPVVLVAFGAEEPRGEGDDLHHFGSQHLVRELTPGQRRALVAMVSLDRVGVGGLVPVCTGGLGDTGVRDRILRTARAVRIPATGCADNRASDHWSFEKAGFDVARLGSTPYAAYHSADDVPTVVQREQLGRTGRLIWAWLRAARGR